MSIQLISDVFFIGLVPSAAIALVVNAFLSVPSQSSRGAVSSPGGLPFAIAGLGFTYLVGVIGYAMTVFLRSSDPAHDWRPEYSNMLIVLQYGTPDLINIVFYGGAVTNVLKSLVGSIPLFIVCLGVYLKRVNSWPIKWHTVLPLLFVGAMVAGLLVHSCIFSRFAADHQDRIGLAAKFLLKERGEPE